MEGSEEPVDLRNVNAFKIVLAQGDHRLSQKFPKELESNT